jgi:hypothetical protein
MSRSAPRPGVVLARRMNCGARVTLLWAEEPNLVFVDVRDCLTGHQFRLVLPPGANALDVYEHPYTYAAWQGIDYQLGDFREAA